MLVLLLPARLDRVQVVDATAHCAAASFGFGVMRLDTAACCVVFTSAQD